MPKISWKEYQAKNVFDEYVSSDQKLRPENKKISDFIAKYSKRKLLNTVKSSERAISSRGITFRVYDENKPTEQFWPLDIIPRIVQKKEWSKISKGLIQRLRALNLFINDVYNEQKIFKEKIIPKNLILDSGNFRKECLGINPPFKVWANICGSDLVRDINGEFLVLEDNLRVPSGVSYMLENRIVMKSVFPEIFERHKISPVDEYCSKLYSCMKSTTKISDPNLAILTPGIYNSAYFEHVYLAQQMGIELVEGADLFVENDKVFMKTVRGKSQLHVLYRRVDDLYLDPKVFNKKSLIGVPGIFKAWKKGNISILNAPGSGVADDKVIYSFVPQMIEFYLKEKPLINQVETFLCYEKKQRDYVFKNLSKLVVKPANESGGYGILIGPKASKKELESCALRIKKNPRNYIAQPLINLSTSPTIVNNHLEPRHIDLRPFILSGANNYVTQGGLTRVALKKGTMIVNSSQGGGSKDTWILDE